MTANSATATARSSRSPTRDPVARRRDGGFDPGTAVVRGSPPPAARGPARDHAPKIAHASTIASSRLRSDVWARVGCRGPAEPWSRRAARAAESRTRPRAPRSRAPHRRLRRARERRGLRRASLGPVLPRSRRSAPTPEGCCAATSRPRQSPAVPTHATGAARGRTLRARDAASIIAASMRIADDASAPRSPGRRPRPRSDRDSVDVEGQRRTDPRAEALGERFGQDDSADRRDDKYSPPCRSRRRPWIPRVHPSRSPPGLAVPAVEPVNPSRSPASS